MRSLSKDAERKLINAIEKAAALVNDGAAPTDAIIKSAREHDVPAGHINLMVHAYNTGRTTTQREKGDSTLEKAADFPLADAGDVLKALYPETVKSSSAIKRAEVVSTEYALPVTGMLARRRNEMQKAAAAQVALPEKTWEPPPRDEHAAVMRAQSEKIAAQRAKEETRRKATIAHSKAAAALDGLSLYFRTPGNMSFGDALREVNLRLGPQGVSVLEKVAAVYPHFTKQADTKQNHFGDNPLYGMVQSVLDAVVAYNDAQEKLPVKKSEAVCKKAAPKFLTGSILAEEVEAPLTLKDAMAQKGGKRVRTTDPGAPLDPSGKIRENIGTLEDPADWHTWLQDPKNAPPSPDHVLVAWTNRATPKWLERRYVHDDLPTPAPTPVPTPVPAPTPTPTPTPTPPTPPKPYILDDQARHEELARQLGVSPTLNSAELREEMRRRINDRNSAQRERDAIDKEEYELTGKPAPGSKQEAKARADEEQARRDEQDKNEDFYEQQLREIDDEIRAKERAADERDDRERSDRAFEADKLDEIRKLKKQHEEEKQKERQKPWDDGKAIGEGLNKAFKGDFMGNALNPIKFVGGLLGQKDIAGLSPVQKKDPKAILREQYQQLTDPSHENALKTIRAKSVMHDMVLNDPVISGYDPQDVAMAFNEIAELAPSLIDVPGMIRPLLRKRLESGQLADFDVKQILEMDKLRADRDNSLTETKEKTLNLL